MRQEKVVEKHVEVGGHGLWTRLAGEGQPVVVFVPGGGGIGLDFAPAHAEIAGHTTALIYDRAGTGQSDDAELPRTAAVVVDELHELLTIFDLPAPYLLVGHSLGGVYVQHFAQRHPSEVSGLVLLDPAHEDFDDYMPDHLKIATRHSGTVEAPEATPELIALARDQITGYVTDWPEPLREQVVDLHTRPDRLLTGFYEGLNLIDVLDELRHGPPRPTLPTTVLTAAGIDPFQAAFTDGPDLRTQIDGTERLAAALAATGNPGRHHTFPEDSHAGLPMRRPDAVVAAITEQLQILS